MVPYPYADHTLRLVGADPNAKCTFDHIQKLIEAAKMLKQIVVDMENLEDIPGFTIYKEDAPKELEEGKTAEDDMKEIMDEETSAMLEKFKNK
jgi:hypothetical protein